MSSLFCFMTSCLRWGCLVATLCLPMSAQSIVAMVTDLQGRATLQRGTLVEELSLTAEVSAGGKVKLESGARVVLVSFATGDQVQAQGPVAFTLDGRGRPEGTAKGVQVVPFKAVRLQEVLKPGGLAQASLVMRAPSRGDFALLQPRSAVVRDRRPAFAWEGCGEGSRYVFVLRDASGREAASLLTGKPEAELPPGTFLDEGATYVWIVSAMLADGATRRATGELRVLSADARALLSRLHSEGRESFSLRLAYAAALQQAGLLEEAKAEWINLSRERPEDPVLRAFAQ